MLSKAVRRHKRTNFRGSGYAQAQLPDPPPKGMYNVQRRQAPTSPSFVHGLGLLLLLWYGRSELSPTTQSQSTSVVLSSAHATNPELATLHLPVTFVLARLEVRHKFAIRIV